VCVGPTTHGSGVRDRRASLSSAQSSTAPHPLQPIVRPRIGSPVLEEFAYCKADVTGDAAQENGRDITPGMKGNGGSPPVRMPKLLVGTLLTHLFETELLQKGGNLTWLQNRDVPHVRQRW
jgi:hypothetical protein